MKTKTNQIKAEQIKAIHLYDERGQYFNEIKDYTPEFVEYLVKEVNKYDEYEAYKTSQEIQMNYHLTMFFIKDETYFKFKRIQKFNRLVK